MDKIEHIQNYDLSTGVIEMLKRRPDIVKKKVSELLVYSHQDRTFRKVNVKYSDGELGVTCTVTPTCVYRFTKEITDNSAFENLTADAIAHFTESNKNQVGGMYHPFYFGTIPLYSVLHNNIMRLDPETKDKLKIIKADFTTSKHLQQLIKKLITKSKLENDIKSTLQGDLKKKHNLSKDRLEITKVQVTPNSSPITHYNDIDEIIIDYTIFKQIINIAPRIYPFFGPRIITMRRPVVKIKKVMKEWITS